jgi:hypothetical protein
MILVLVSACTPSGNGSSSPLDGSAAPATAWRPETGGCHDVHSLHVGRAGYSAADCAKSHTYQTVYVGEVDRAVAGASTSPEQGSPQYLDVWRDCDKRLAMFFGGPWRDFRLKLRVSFPAVSAWDAGARWYSCETAVYDHYSWESTSTTGSLEGGAGRLAELRLGCYQTPASSAVPVTPKACTEPHNLEYVGTKELFVPWSSIETGDSQVLFDLCGQLVDTFVGEPVGSWVAAWHPFESDWKAGDRGIRCFLWLRGAQVSKSLKGAGARGWPRP